MAKPGVSLGFDFKQWNAFFKKTGTKLDNPFLYLKAGFAIYGFQDVIKHFENEEGPEGKWPGRSPRVNSLYDWAKKKGFGAQYDSGNKLLQMTGNLRQNLRMGNVRPSGKKGMVFFNPVPYAKMHDEGTTKKVPFMGVKLKGIPQREFMWLSDGAQKKIHEFVLNSIFD